MVTLETMALVLGVANGFLLVVRPIGRIHSRIDLLDERYDQIETALSRIEKRLEYEITRMNARNP